MYIDYQTYYLLNPVKTRQNPEPESPGNPCQSLELQIEYFTVVVGTPQHCVVLYSIMTML